jgi:hypothetical protein
MVHLSWNDRYKHFLRMGIGDEAFPESGNKRQKAPFRGAILWGNRSANEKPFAERKATLNYPSSCPPHSTRSEPRSGRRRLRGRRSERLPLPSFRAARAGVPAQFLARPNSSLYLVFWHSGPPKPCHIVPNSAISTVLNISDPLRGGRSPRYPRIEPRVCGQFWPSFSPLSAPCVLATLSRPAAVLGQVFQPDIPNSQAGKPHRRGDVVSPSFERLILFPDPSTLWPLCETRARWFGVIRCGQRSARGAILVQPRIMLAAFEQQREARYKR